MEIFDKNRIYFMGIGGSSMSSLADIMKARGYSVCGSDMQSSHTTDRLQSEGISVHIGQKASNIDCENPDIAVKTDAVSDSNPEVVRSVEKGIPVYRRAELLGEILNSYKTTVGVAGTNGKTTCSSMITSVLLSAGLDPSAIIGGHMKLINSSYRLGSDTCVFESCEFRDSFLYFKSDISVVLNISDDHMEYFHTTENLINSFRKYLCNIKPGGTLVFNCEDPNSWSMIGGYDGKRLSFGLSSGDFHADRIECEKGLYSFELIASGAVKGRISLSVPGFHNIYNALAAAAASYLAGADFAAITNGLHNYNGAGRRFEYHCTVNGAVIADDYGHHPDAYRVIFRTAKELGFKRIIAIHQPHTFSRTKLLMNEFVEVLSTVDHVLVLPVYAARETNDEYNVYAEDLVEKLPNAEYVPSFEAVARKVSETARPGDLFITLGCGDVYKAAELITSEFGTKV